MTDSETKSERVLKKLTKIILTQTQLKDMISIETPTFILVHKKTNVSSLPFDMEIDKNTFQLPGFFNLTTNNKQINATNQITLKVNDFILQ